MDNYVDLNRQFRELTDVEADNPEQLTFLHGYTGAGSSWDSIIDYSRVTILAEAGSGKTRELQAQRDKLKANGSFAFFIPIEDLNNNSLQDVLALNPNDAAAFKSWEASGDIAWFFLDAVDELKLVNGKLERAFARLAAALGSVGIHRRCEI